MSALFQELDYRTTEIGAVSLRRRRDLRLGMDVFEIKLGDAFLMSSAFTVSEIALARLGLAAANGRQLDVIIGGLGLGYTANAVLECPRLRSLIVVEMLEPVIDWHRTGLVPLGTVLAADPRCRLVQGDFFGMSASDIGFDPKAPRSRYDAILLDIDHAPDKLLDERSHSFYHLEGLATVERHLKPGGIFGLWSNDPPDQRFTDRLARVFSEAWTESVIFHNPLLDQNVEQTVYLARASDMQGEVPCPQ